MKADAKITLRAKWGPWKWGICYLRANRRAIASVTRWKRKDGKPGYFYYWSGFFRKGGPVESEAKARALAVAGCSNHTRHSQGGAS